MGKTVGKSKKIGFYAAGVILGLLALLFRRLYLGQLSSYLLYPDTAEYFDAAQNLALGRIDLMRMPLYPLFLLVVSRLSGTGVGTDAFVAVTVDVQCVLSSVGILFLYHSLVMLLSRPLQYRPCSIAGRIGAFGSDSGDKDRPADPGTYSLKAIAGSFLAAGLAAIHPALVNWDFLILTESLTIFWMILLVWSWLRYTRTFPEKSPYSERMPPRVGSLIQIFIFSAFLAFTKPFYLALPGLLLLLLALFAFFNGRSARAHLLPAGICTLSVYLLMGTYCVVNGVQNNYYGLTGVSGINSFGKILQYRMEDLGEEGQILEQIRQETARSGEPPEPAEFAEKYGYDRENYQGIRDFAESIIRKNPLRYMKETLKLIFWTLLDQRALTDYNNRVFIVDPWVRGWMKMLGGSVFTYAVLYVLLAAWILLSAGMIACKQSGPRAILARAFLLILVLYQIAMTLAGAHGEYARLIAPVLVVVLILCTDLLITGICFVIRLYKSPG
ncbi:MAG TPA: hypothetical protein DD727_07810 [Clostridiales bacterium]|nr:hypothetical protein [Clostridiales bacterium]